MLGTVNFGVFLVSGIILNIIPGSDTFYIISRSVSAGKKAGLVSVLGISTGILVHTILAALGLSAILASSQKAFDIVKYAGVLYLLFLGISTILSKRENINLKVEENLGLKSIYLQGVLTNVLNPKVALFFIAFLPQFVNVNADMGIIPFIILGLTFATTGTIWMALVASFSSYATEKLRNDSKVSYYLNKISGIVYIGLGLKLLSVKAAK